MSDNSLRQKQSIRLSTQSFHKVLESFLGRSTARLMVQPFVRYMDNINVRKLGIKSTGRKQKVSYIVMKIKANNR